jgi:regulator of RNase E activity RraA
MNMAIGFKVLKRKRDIAPSVIEKFRKIPVANISDSMNRLTAGGPRLRPYHSGGVLCGPALTVKSRPGDNLMAHAALAMARPGDVIVVDAGGDLTNAIVGERMMLNAQRRGFGGFVVDGAIRDLEWCKKNSFPVYAAGVTHRGPYKTGPGEINVPIAIDGMVCEPGDLVIGDEDGLLVIPYDHIDAVYAAACKKNLAEANSYDAIGTGDQVQEEIEMIARLKALGCDFEA